MTYKIPAEPGVYKFIDKEGMVLYIGKAINLRNRVKSYFQNSKEKSVRTQKMIEQISDVQFITVDSDLEAILLETNLIKELRPKYNILMRDDKNFVYIKVHFEDDYPRISIVRKVEKDNAKYFGPKTAKWKVEKTFDLLHRIFPFRNCKLQINWKDGNVEINNKVIKYPCLEYHIKRCSAPCIGNINPTDYKVMIDQIISFLSGKHDVVINGLKEKMMIFAKEKKFEQAAKIRDQILAVEDIMEKQKISSPDHIDQDLISFISENGNIYFNLFMIRDGRLVNQENFTFEGELSPLDKGDKGDLDPEIYESFIKQYYETAADIPKEILISKKLEEQDLIEKWLTDLKGSKVKIIIPQKGQKNKLLELSQKNAQNFANQNKTKFEQEKVRTENAPSDLKDILVKEGLEIKTIDRIECYDISHLAGTHTVGSMVVFENGKAKPSDYRQFKIKNLENGQIDDCKSIEEVLTRRLKYLSDSKEKLEIYKKSDFDLPQGYAVRRAKKVDLTRINEFMVDFSWKTQESPENFYVLTKDKKVIGCARLTYKEKNKFGHIRYVYVDKKYRGQKIALKLVKKVIQESVSDLIYMTCRKNLAPYYCQLLFTTEKNIPDEFQGNLERTAKRAEEGAVLLKYDDDRQVGHFHTRKARKNDLESIFKLRKDWGRDNNWIKSEEGFFVLERETMRGKKVIGTVALVKRDELHHEIISLIIDEKYRGQKLSDLLLNKVIEECPLPTVYLLCKPEIKDIYLAKGFQELNVTPKAFESSIQCCKENYNEDSVILIYDKYKNTVKKDESFYSRPDLIVVDGGKGQLSSAQFAMDNLNLNIPIIGLAKQNEEIVISGQRLAVSEQSHNYEVGKLESENFQSILLPKNSQALQLLQRIRDEAHRFAISFNRKLRTKNLIN